MARDQKSCEKLAGQIVAWFQENARDLPWRRTNDPYAIWISEVMLQQTQVKTVIPYWERWMTLFPNVETLADAAEEDVLKAWEGLGYYSRARNLQKAARKICAVNEGDFPSSHEEILELPGVGRYTAGAICSIAFGRATAILDGNVARVLSRVFAIAGSVKDPATQKKLWALSTALVRTTSNCSALNQGLMEIGALLCLPRAPLCEVCPLKRRCKARREGRVDKYPARPEATTIRKREFVALVIRRRGKVLIRKRARGVVNGGLWEFPNFEVAPGQSAAQTVESFGVELKFLRTIKHTITHNRITMHAFAGEANGDSRLRDLASHWRPIRALQTLPFSSAHARLRALVQGAYGISIEGGVA